MKKIEINQNEINTSVFECAVDFHTHLLPDMDDGSSSTEETLEMLKVMKEQGVSTVIATPHFYPQEESPHSFLKRRKKACERLLEVYDPAQHPKIYLGAEVAYFSGIGRSRYVKDLVIEGTNVILVEMPFTEWSDSVFSEIYCLRETLGLIPIIAHFERYSSGKKRGALKKICANGALIQSNAGHFLDPKNGKKAVRAFCKGEIQLLGSDCHNMTVRLPNLNHALDRIVQHKDGMAMLDEMQNLQEFLLNGAISIENISK